MSGHTPGPWEIGEPEVLSGGLSVPIHSASHGEFATVVWRMEDDYSDNSPSPKCEANARLIAAAPELLHCLKVIVCHAEGLDMDATLHLDEARAAIAKAKGDE